MEDGNATMKIPSQLARCKRDSLGQHPGVSLEEETDHGFTDGQAVRRPLRLAL